MKKYDDVDEQTLRWINKALSYSGYPSHVEKQKIKEHIKEIETMENNKVRQFVDLLVNEEETIENAAKVTGIGDMKLVDVLKTISMLLIHDLVEIDAGDTYAYDEKGLETQKAREKAAKERIYSLLPDDQTILAFLSSDYTCTD